MIVIFLAILIPAVTLRSAPDPQQQQEVPEEEEEADQEKRPLNPEAFYVDQDSEVLKQVRQALTEVPLIDTWVADRFNPPVEYWVTF